MLQTLTIPTILKCLNHLSPKHLNRENLEPVIWFDIRWTILIQIFYRCSIRPWPIFKKDVVTPSHTYSIDHLSVLPVQQKWLKFSLIWKHQRKSHFSFLCGIHSVILCVSRLFELEKLLSKKSSINICNSDESKQSLLPYYSL